MEQTQKAPKVIGIAGPAGAGKDELGSMILRAIDHSYKYSMAKPMKSALTASLGYGRAELFGCLKEVVSPVFGFSPRAALQEFGSCLRKLNPDIWLTLAGLELEKSNFLMIVCDIRYENEADWVRSNDGIIIHVERDSAKAVRTHHSEAGVGRHIDDLLFDNNDTLDAMEKWVKVVSLGFKD